jgi:mevalonate kinase
MIEASACGKAILLGEHAVVYDQPAIAIPLPDLRTRVKLGAMEEQSQASIHIQAHDMDEEFWLHERDDRDPLAFATRLALLQIGVEKPERTLEMSISSPIPIASGLGSGAAISIAIIRAVVKYYGKVLDEATISSLAYQVEVLHHGTPSGIDNAVIAFERPLYFLRGADPDLLIPGDDVWIVLGHSGVGSQTKDVVAGLNARWRANSSHYDQLFTQVGNLVRRGQQALLRGEFQELGGLMNENHALLQEMGVSIPELDTLVTEARKAGAWGAKLSGAGAGGFMIALTSADQHSGIMASLKEAGAVHVLSSQVPS